ncbi:putative peptide maturation dehydrogenase [Pseudoduganella ginsengisoli]|uniref:Putative peptide maturation dehydrogenase n=1 Tax=Pseudoduganella ginsengisoli TaxID=1462440 RepID=A0A6L6Q5J5_9BURK|nr:putative peptide maturation dehydrogenase [Pseudoduganella ginsengisoli]MTW04805.1 putative peptide maturation dehydrogenase [Pseudoduganella ginsengisoli]
MLARRCAVLLIEPREALELDWQAMLSGGGALAASLSWVALAPHLDREVPVAAEDVAALGRVGQTVWQPVATLEQQLGDACVARLLACGLLVADGGGLPDGLPDALAHFRARDDVLRAQHWRPLSAVAHMFSRWRGMRSESGMQFPTFDELVQVYGQPPEPAVTRGAQGCAIALPQPEKSTLDGVLLRRYTGRNFDTKAQMPLALAARLLQRTFGAQGRREMAPGASVLKKTSPSAGGLHPCEAYVLAQRIDGVAPGLYHYHAVDHVLEPLHMMSGGAARQLALVAVADQQWFADAPWMVIVAARVARNFWKYRNHAKAHRALLLDAGHLSQTLYLLAAEAGMAGFVTAAINEGELEQALGLDPLADMVVAVCGCGLPAPGDYVELRQ